jgi:hypothetical protein
LLRKEIQSHTPLALALADALLGTSNPLAKNIIDPNNTHPMLPHPTTSSNQDTSSPPPKKCLTSKQPSSKTPFVATFHFEIEGK